MAKANRTGLTQFRTASRITFPFFHLFIFFIFSTAGIQAQDNNISHVTVTLKVSNMPLQQVLLLLENQIPYKFAYNSDLIGGQRSITLDVTGEPLDEVMRTLLRSTEITWKVIENQIVLQQAEKPVQVTISGFVKDSLSGEALPWAVIFLPEKNRYTYTNNYGFYSVTENRTDSLDMMISYVGYTRVHQKVRAQGNVALNFYLPGEKTRLNSVVITRYHADDNVRKDLPGKADMSMEMVRSAPSVNGTGDIISTIRMMPGVLAGLDGRPGYFIRGGNTDQNLVQLDEAMLYNPDHMLGLVGIFNSPAIKSAYLLKAGFPASFGDHLSSVLDVTMNDGNERQWGGDVQAGTITGGLALSGPVSRKASILVAARRSTIDLLLAPLKLSDYYSNYRFYDINAKLNFQVTQNDRLYLSFYQGRDNSAYLHDTSVRYAINYRVRYGNSALALRWNHVFSPKLFANTSLIYNRYFHDVIARQRPFYAELYSGIHDMVFKSDFYYYPSLNHKISAGINYLYQTQYPATVLQRDMSTDSSLAIHPDDISAKYAQRIALYFDDEFRLYPALSVYIGARIPLYATHDVRYLGFEPRISLMQLLNSSTSIKISYTRMHQFLNRVQSFNASFPAEIWIGSDKTVKPQNCQEASIGIFKNFKENVFHTSLEFYYKHMGNQIMFREGLQPAISSNMDSTLVFGQGRSYGAELYLSKNTGRLTGWLAYTLSFSKQQFDSLNRGKEFPFINDRRHSLYLSMSYAISPHWQISSNFIFTSGNAFSLFKEIAANPYNPMYYNNVSGTNDGTGSTGNKIQNNYRLSPYNRLDLSLTYRKSTVMFNRTS